MSGTLLRRLFIIASSFVLGMTLGAAPAQAGGGYPYRGAYSCGLSAWCVDENRNGRYDAGEEFSPYGFVYRNCTDWVAYRINSLVPSLNFHNGYGGRRFGNGNQWDDNARALGWTVSTTPKPRSIGVTNAGTFGHVAFVESVNSDGSVNVSEYNSILANGTFSGAYRTRSGARFDAYIYVPGLTQVTPPAPSPLARYAKTIVKWSGNSTTSWFVTPDLKRLWIPDGGTYEQLRARGFAGPYVLDSATLNQLPDQTNQWVASGATWGHRRTLRRGMEVRSSDGRYRFAMQGDGNLVLYGPSGRALWATDRYTSNWRSQEMVIFQTDGNLVTYGGGRAIWSSNTAGRSGSRFVVQSDGNLVIYAGTRAIWASNTNGQV